MNVVVIVGNPKIGSRTGRAAALLESGSPEVVAAKQASGGADLLEFASRPL
jgi:hypothetical protein